MPCPSPLLQIGNTLYNSHGDPTDTLSNVLSISPSLPHRARIAELVLHFSSQNKQTILFVPTKAAAVAATHEILSRLSHPLSRGSSTLLTVVSRGSFSLESRTRSCASSSLPCRPKRPLFPPRRINRGNPTIARNSDSLPRDPRGGGDDHAGGGSGLSRRCGGDRWDTCGNHADYRGGI